MIVRAQPEHADSLTQIAITAKRHWHYPEAWIQIWLPALAISAEYVSKNETWLAILNGEPVAYYSLKEDANELWLDNLWVLPEHMGRGIGKELFIHALERSRGRGASAIKIEADPNAEAFYKYMGASKVDETFAEIDGSLRVLPVMEYRL